MIMIMKKSVLHYILFDGKDKTLFYTKQVFFDYFLHTSFSINLKIANVYTLQKHNI